MTTEQDLAQGTNSVYFVEVGLKPVTFHYLAHYLNDWSITEQLEKENKFVPFCLAEYDFQHAVLFTPDLQLSIILVIEYSIDYSSGYSSNQISGQVHESLNYSFPVRFSYCEHLHFQFDWCCTD